MLRTFSSQSWNEHFPDSTQELAIKSLESGEILYFPKLAFQLLPEEKIFLSPDYADPNSKNISYYPPRNQLRGVKRLLKSEQQQLKTMLARFSRLSFKLIQELLPRYTPHLMIGKTSFRPIEIADRVTSYRKDDKRLHVDAFPASPNQGKRILRIFCNINPHGKDRVWRIGEDFTQVAKQFLPKIKSPLPGSAWLLHLLKITKSYRTRYDHNMLQIHDLMKEDEPYQKNATQQEVRFPPNSTWIVQTDQVSHAAMSGQYVLEQTFYLPVNAMLNESLSPLRILEKMCGEKLV